MGAIDRAFIKVDRRDFVSEGQRQQAHVDRPLSIGFGQTISQPSTVRLMLTWLNPKTGDRVLDVGSGSGWTAALLASIVGPSGEVYAVDIIPELVERGKENCMKAGFHNISFFVAGSELGLPEYGPYDRILVSAAANTIPDSLRRQLMVGGKMIIPVRGNVHELTKLSSNRWREQVHSGFVFVPLIESAMEGSRG